MMMMIMILSYKGFKLNKFSHRTLFFITFDWTEYKMLLYIHFFFLSDGKNVLNLHANVMTFSYSTKLHKSLFFLDPFK